MHFVGSEDKLSHHQFRKMKSWLVSAILMPKQCLDLSSCLTLLTLRSYDPAQFKNNSRSCSWQNHATSKLKYCLLSTSSFCCYIPLCSVWVTQEPCLGSNWEPSFPSQAFWAFPISILKAGYLVFLSKNETSNNTHFKIPTAIMYLMYCPL